MTLPMILIFILVLQTSDLNVMIAMVILDHLGFVRRDKLLSVLQRHAILFDNLAPLGKIPSIKHSISKTDLQPVCTRQWRRPECTRATIHEECDKKLLDISMAVSCSFGNKER